MNSELQDFPSRLTAQSEELIGALAHAEKTILATIERECEALRTRRMLAAKSLHERLCEATRIYLDCSRAARAGIHIMEQALPGCRQYLEQRRAAFSPVLQIELAVLGAQRAAAEAAVAEKQFLAEAAQSPHRAARLISGGSSLGDSDQTAAAAKPQSQLPQAYPRPSRRLRAG